MSSATSASQESRALMVLLAQNFGTDVVTVYVGNKRKKFVIHRNLLPDTICGSIVTKVHMSTCNTEVFSLFVGWLYRGVIPRRQQLPNLFKLYDFAREHDIVHLADTTMDGIQDEYYLLHSFPDVKLLAEVYKSFGIFSGLPILCLDLVLYQYQQDNKEQGSEELEDDERKVDIDYTFTLTSTQLREYGLCAKLILNCLWELLMHYSCFVIVELQIHAFGTRTISMTAVAIIYTQSITIADH